MILELFKLDGKIALVTGGTRGIGLGIVRALAEAGAHVVLSSRVPKESVLGILKADGLLVNYIQADMEHDSAPASLVAATIALAGRLDILVNNAGIAEWGDTHSFSADQYDRVMQINVHSVFRACQAALQPMMKQKSGVILNIGSISGMVSNIPQPQAAYNASKAAVHMFTRSIASDYAAHGIRANAIAPGYIETDMTVGGLSNPEWAPTWRAMTPLPMVGSPQDIGAAALYLCSEASRYVTGEVLVVDGGYTAR